MSRRPVHDQAQRTAATQPAQQSSSSSNRRWPLFRVGTPPVPQPLSHFSSPSVPNSGWPSENFMFGAGMVILQPSTDRVVVVHDAHSGAYFLPRGRKDIGESLEATALREAYEESGYQAEFLPLWNPTQAPSSPMNREARYEKNHEPIYVTLTSWRPAKPGHRGRKFGGEYIVSWYVGQIGPGAVRHEGTGMPDEQSYTSDLYTYEDAYNLLHGSEKDVLRYAFVVYAHTVDEDEQLRRSREKRLTSTEVHPRSCPGKAALSTLTVWF